MMVTNTGARYEIAVDGKPRSYRDVRATAIEAATYLKQRMCTLRYRHRRDDRGQTSVGEMKTLGQAIKSCLLGVIPLYPPSIQRELFCSDAASGPAQSYNVGRLPSSPQPPRCPRVTCVRPRL
jgi:hypothetical protein